MNMDPIFIRAIRG